MDRSLTGFQLDEAHKLGALDDPGHLHLSPNDSSSDGGAEEDELDDLGIETKKSSVQLCRKVIPVLEEEDTTCCSICLDDFTQEDPSIATTCGHGYHLQCIMQWAQRSRECPLCFRGLQLQDEGMNSLLPFGEYVNPQAEAATAALLENWEMERFLVSLAVAEDRQRRVARASRRRSHPQAAVAEPSAPRPIFGGVRQRTASQPVDIGPAPSTSAPHGGADAAAAAAAGGSGTGEFPASWPPSRSEDGRQQLGEGAATPPLRAGAQALKTRLRESFTKTTKELKSLFAPSSSSSARQ